MPEENAWETDAFRRRVAALDRTRLRDLYPSEAWSIYRTIPQCSNVLDLGCADGRLAPIVHALSPECVYTGVDLNEKLVARARRLYPGSWAEFVEENAVKYLLNSDQFFDCIMGWAMLYAIPDYLTLLSAMIQQSRRWVIFDMRLASVDEDIVDVSRANTCYGDCEAPYVIGSYGRFMDYLTESEARIRRIELSGYYYPPGPTCWLADDVPDPVVVSVLLEKADRNFEGEPELFVRVPPPLAGEETA